MVPSVSLVNEAELAKAIDDHQQPLFQEHRQKLCCQTDKSLFYLFFNG
jgi:hypothetical protein